MKIKVSIVIPVFNEEGNILELIKEISTIVKKQFEYEIIVIDDCSNDSTLKILTSYKKKIKNLLIIKHEKNYGQSISLKTGIMNSKFHNIVTLDGDGQNDPADIFKMVKKFKNDKDFMMVIGNRINRNDKFTRRAASRLAFKVRKVLLRDDTPDTGCAIKVFKKHDFLRLPFFNHIHRFLPFFFKAFGGTVISVPVNHRSRKSGVSKYSNLQRFLVGIRDLFGVIWLKSRIKWPINSKKVSNFKIVKRGKYGN